MIDIVIPTIKPIPELTALLDEIRRHTEEEHNVIVQSSTASAAVNRNQGLAKSKADIVVLVDDDICGFYIGWLTDLVSPFEENKDILYMGARLLNIGGDLGSQMGAQDNMNVYYYPAPRIPTSCVAISRKVIISVKFNEEFVGSGYEDTQFCNDINKTFGTGKIWINNICRLVHKGEMKNQGGLSWQHNHALYMKLNPNDKECASHTDWTANRPEPHRMVQNPPLTARNSQIVAPSISFSTIDNGIVIINGEERRINTKEDIIALHIEKRAVRMARLNIINEEQLRR